MRWIVDEDGALGITFWNILTLVKYKTYVMKYWFRKYPDAPKRICSALLNHEHRAGDW